MTKIVALANQRVASAKRRPPSTSERRSRRANGVSTSISIRRQTPPRVSASWMPSAPCTTSSSTTCRCGEIILPTEIPTLFLAPGTVDLVGAEVELRDAIGREYCLKRVLDPIATDYDYILIDLPPSLGLLTVNGLTAANSVLVPLQAEYFALKAYPSSWPRSSDVQSAVNPAPGDRGIVADDVRRADEPARQVAEEVPTALRRQGLQAPSFRETYDSAKRHRSVNRLFFTTSVRVEAKRTSAGQGIRSPRGERHLMNQKKVLGRGLGALIPQRQEQPAAPAEARATQGLAEIPISQIQPNPYQPRKTFNEASIEELARSVREHGIVQPLVVTRAGDKYKLIAGERRFRAAQKAGLTTVPALIKEMMQEGDAL